MADLEGSNYSETDSANNNAAPLGMPEGMAPSGVNDAWRAGMGAIKRAFDHDHAGTWCTVSGSANVINLTYQVAPAAYVQGQKYAFKSATANTAATTINVNSLGALSLFKKSASGPVACTGGEMQVGDLIEVEHDGTQLQLISAAATTVGKQPTLSILVNPSGTYTVPAGVTHLFVRMIGGGGGGAGSASGVFAGGGGGNGGNSTFGSLTALGGGAAGTFGNGGSGSSSLGGDIAIAGGVGHCGIIQVAGMQGAGGAGGVSFFGGNGAGQISAAGGSAVASSGSGGAGGGFSGAGTGGGGGGAGGYLEKLIVTPSATYSYSVGTSGAAGTAGTSGQVGGAGATGLVIVEEYYD